VKGRTINPWTAEEERIMRTMYGTITYREIAKILGRSMSSVEGKAKDMQLSYSEIETPQLFQKNARQRHDGTRDCARNRHTEKHRLSAHQRDEGAGMKDFSTTQKEEECDS
jgi:hypothetical protein